jgi:hypothetical protein
MDLVAENEPRLLANTINTKYEINGVAGAQNGTVSGDDISYWKDLLNEQEKQLLVKIEDADNKLKRLQESGSGNNYVARFEFLKQLFDIDLKEAYSRALSAYVGLRAIHSIDIPLPTLTDTGYLDKLAIWARTVTYELEKKFFNRRDTIIAFALNDLAAAGAPSNDLPSIMNQSTFDSGRASGTWTFNILEAFFQRLNAKFKNPRLRGLDAHVFVNDDKAPMQFWRILLKLPSQKVPLVSGLPTYSYEPEVYVPMSTYPRHVVESLELPNQREVYNIAPVGEWTVRIEGKSIMGTPTNDPNVVGNIILRMRISYEKD